MNLICHQSAVLTPQMLFHVLSLLAIAVVYFSVVPVVNGNPLGAIRSALLKVEAGKEDKAGERITDTLKRFERLLAETSNVSTTITPDFIVV